MCTSLAPPPDSRCFFESCASSLVKSEYCLWDDRFYLSSSVEGTAVDAAVPAAAMAPVATCKVSMAGSAAGGAVPASAAPEASEQGDVHLLITPHYHLDGLRQTLRAGRRAPLSPTAFAWVMRQRVAEGSLAFTSSNADMEMVISLYTAGFVAAFDTYPAVCLGHNIIDFFGLHFGTDEQAAQLAAALSYVSTHCDFPHGSVRISAEGNGFTARSKAALREAIQGCAGIEALYL